MATGRQTLYEVLGVSAHAKTHDIARAYQRIRADMKKETTVPDPRFAALAKMAYETLSDSTRRAEYDESIGLVATLVRKKRKFLGGAAAVVVGMVVVFAGYMLWQRPAHAPTGERLSSVAELLQSVGPRVGRVQGALVSGEIRDLGLAVETGEGEMMLPCDDIAPGMALGVVEGTTTLRAELGRVLDAQGLCALAVKGVRDGAKPRTDVPPPQEALQAIVLGPKGEPQARQVSVARALPDPKGVAFALKAAVALPNGTPIFDAQERLVGQVLSPHPFGPGLVAAIGAARIVQAHGNAPTQVAKAPPAATMSSPPTAASPVPASKSGPAPSLPAATLPAPSSGRGLGHKVGEGFTTLWKEDDGDRSLAEVLDDVTKGSVGLPLAYWTRWEDGDKQLHSSHCTVTGPQGTVADYDQIPTEADEPGYWYCALTRFVTELDDLRVGEYTFTLFVDGRQVAERSIRIERRIFTPGRLILLVLVVGCGLLLWLRRNREVVDEVDRVV